MKSILYVVAGIILVCIVAIFHQRSTPCYEAIPAQQDTGRQLLLNKCTGETWMLARVTLRDEKGKDTGFTYRWSPLNSHIEEPVFENGR